MNHKFDRYNERFLIINADDLGMCHSFNEAILTLLLEGAISSTSFMVTCPWAMEAAAFISEHKEFDVGIHLTFTSEWEHYKWGPISRRDIETLVDPYGYFPPSSQMVELNADSEQLRLEMIAQIEMGLKMGIDPTHLDNHMISLQGLFTGRDFMDLIIDVCVKYQLPYRFAKKPQHPFYQNAVFVKLAAEKGIELLDDVVMLPFDLQTDEDFTSVKHNAIAMLRGLEYGVTEWVLHPAIESGEMKSISPDWKKRKYEFDLFRDKDVQGILREEKIKLITWRHLREYQRSRR